MVVKTIAAIICASSLALPIYKGYQLKNKIKKCWPAIKCTPLGQILHPIFGPSNVSITQNSQSCDSGKFSSMFSSSISEHSDNVSMLTSITESISNGLNDARKKIQSMEKSAFDDLSDIATKIFKAYGRIAQLLVVVYGIISKISTVFKDFLDLMRLTYYTLGSTWNGPIGGTARYFGGLL